MGSGSVNAFKKKQKKDSAHGSEVVGSPVTDPTASSRVVSTAGGLLDRAQELQAPAVKKYVDSIRRKYPDDSPAQIITRLERRFLTAVTGSGGAVGATAAIPGVGTATAFGAMTGETLLFIEASALLTLAIAEVHGIRIEETERRKALVMTVALGEEGIAALGRLVGTRGGALRRLGASSVSGGRLAAYNKMLVNRLTRRYALRKAPLVVGKLLPAGVGAAIGGFGNRALGKRVISNAEAAFGPPPPFWTIDAEIVDAPPLPERRR